MITNQCIRCIHLNMNTDKLTCDAFPDGIPSAILRGYFDHRKKYKNDNGIRFEKV